MAPYSLTMKTITPGEKSAKGCAHLALPPYSSDGRWWGNVGQEVAKWLDSSNINPLEALWIVPHASHVRLARASWDTQRVWMPRLESWGALRSRLIASVNVPSGGVTFRVATDRLVADQLLQSTAWGQRLASQDRPAYEAVLTRLVELAQSLAQHRLNLGPRDRDEWLVAARDCLGEAQRGIAHLEGVLANVALEWAALDERSLPLLARQQMERSWILMSHSPDGKISLIWEQWASQLSKNGESQVLILSVETQPVPPMSLPNLELCNTFEDEAQHAVARIARTVNDLRAKRSNAAIALLAEDRLLVRRIHALLHEAGFSVLDESGWKLSTSRAASVVMALLRLAAPRATADDLVDYLKGRISWLPPSMQRDSANFADEIEHVLRQHRWTSARFPSSAPVCARWSETLSTGAWSMWVQSLSVASSLRWQGVIPHRKACAQLSSALYKEALWHGLIADAAGKSLIEELSLETAIRGEPRDTEKDFLVTHGSFLSWVDAVLEDGRFHPDVVRNGAPDVIVTSLNQAMWRSFPAWIFPSMDAVHVSPIPHSMPLLNRIQAEEIGLLDASLYADQQRAYLENLFAQPNVFPIARKQEGGAALEISPLWQELVLRVGVNPATAAADDPREFMTCQALATRPPFPRVVGHLALLPRTVTASSYDALRHCPYQFFGRSVLGLRAIEELDNEFGHRDLGTWLHDTLHDFHSTTTSSAFNSAQMNLGAAKSALMRCAEQAAQRLGLVGPDLLPHLLWLEGFSHDYLEWYAAHCQDGYAYRDGEAALTATPSPLAAMNLQLKGRIDRIDAHGESSGASLLVVDYKTGGAQKLRERLKLVGEDTQLPMYTAILSTNQPNVSVSAAYLPLQTRPLKMIKLENPANAAESLVRGIVKDWRAMEGGAPLSAMGEGAVCEYCEMRRLCRRDHWSDSGMVNHDVVERA